MATATAKAPANSFWADRLAESLDPRCINGIIIGVAGWPVGFGIQWLGKKWERVPFEYLGTALTYLGAILAALLVARWILYMVSPRTGTLLDSEVGAYFLSPIAYLVLIGLLVITTINFWLLVETLTRVRAEAAGELSPIAQFVAYNLWFWLGMLFVIPVITMRLIAEEKRSGTIEVLMTAPVTETQVVLSKFFASLLFYGLAVSPTTILLLILRFAGKYEFEVLPVVATYIGTFTVGAMFLSVGLFFSSMTKNQIIAAMLTFAVLILLFSTFVLEDFSTQLGAWADVVKYVAVLAHLGDLGKGVMDLKYILFHVSVVIFMLFVTVKVVEARKWR